jgi:hypothetical protein
MRHLNFFLAVLIFGVGNVAAQNSAAGKPYLLSLSPDCDPTSLSIDFFLTGSFGGYGSFIRTDRKGCEFQIPTSEDGKMAKTLKLIVKGPKYKTLIFDFPSLDVNGGRIEAKLEPHTQIEFKGKISSTEPITDNWMQLTVFYVANWKCDFYQLMDCFLGPDRIATADIDAEGGFRVLLPDFASDTALAGFPDKGRFNFFISDRKGGNRVYDLRPELNRSDIPVASKYPGTILFVAKRSN